jgi:hypothetical protein
VIEVGIVTGDWLLDGHIEISTGTDPGCRDWHTLTIYRHSAEVLTVALSPDQDRELGKRLTSRANSVTNGPQDNGAQEETPQRRRKRRTATTRRPLTRPPGTPMS